MSGPAEEDLDENLWLEDIHGDAALAWARARMAEAHAALDSPETEALAGRIREVLDSDDRIPFVTKRGPHYYGFWRDAAHPRGLWRRTTLASYLTAEPDWELLLDIDALGAAEGTEWVFAGARLLPLEFDRALVQLSPDGGDAFVVREFDIPSRSFVPDGFVLPAAKSRIGWISRDEVFVGTYRGEGSMTSSSYPRTVHRWRRGTPLSDAVIVHEVGVDDLSVSAWHDPTVGFERDLVSESYDFYRSRLLLLTAEGSVSIETPLDASVEAHREWLLVMPRSDWRVGDAVVATGELVAFRLDAFLAGDRTFTRVVTPSPSGAIEDWTWTRSRLLVTMLDDVASRVLVVDPADWSCRDLLGVPALSSVAVVDSDPDESDEFWLTATGFTTPATLLRGEIGEVPTIVKRAPSFFDESRFEVSQHFAVSDDGTRVPYFQVAPRGLALDGTHRTLLSGYGGFLASELPSYSGVIGRAWLERGGVYVLANIRGGGEYGPAWHAAAVQENRHRAYEDFAAVARDLVARGVTTASRLACEGRSNGGLLVGNMLTQYPELFGAVVCGVPLLDMRRYTRLSAGASWIAEYGDPDVPEHWEFIRTFSPYHLLEPGVRYPPALFYATTSDDRVGPVQARKMVERMRSLGADVLYLENEDGGHAGAVDNSEAARLAAERFEFAWTRLTSGT